MRAHRDHHVYLDQPYIVGISFLCSKLPSTAQGSRQHKQQELGIYVGSASRHTSLAGHYSQHLSGASLIVPCNGGIDDIQRLNGT